MKRSLLSKSGEPMYLEYIFPFQRPSSSETYRTFSIMSTGVSPPQRPNSGPSLLKRITHFTLLFTHSCYVQSIISGAAENVKMCDTVYTFNDLWAFQGWCGELNYPKIWEKETGLLKLMRGWERCRCSKNRDQTEPKYRWGHVKPQSTETIR